ncbi:MAG TPA: gliding motility-associated ABC transporter substrate-binding protein GldG [Salinivirgaceae bacterium]|nr:gliding motility-associated ABC transporter substrate-binding protein GldG [Salinivirgaceae bacterium]
MDKKRNKRYQITQFIAFVVILIAVAFISNRLFFRIDLTEDKRFSINTLTKEQINNLEDIVFFKVYIDGELPADFKELRQSVLDLLNELRAISPLKIHYEFVNPSENPDPSVRRDVYLDLIRKGLQPYTIRTETKDGVVEKYVFPGLSINYREKQIFVNLFSNSSENPNIPLEQLVNEAKEKLEYSVLNAVKNITTIEAKKIAIIQGWGGLKEIETHDAAYSLAEMYRVAYLELNERIFSLQDTLAKPKFDAIIIAKPYERISDRNKYLIDQYIMNGGKVLWLLDYVDVNMDSLSRSRTTTAMPIGRNLNLDDMLFKYGVRVNSNIIQDLQAAPIPVNTAPAGAEPRFSPVKWVYFPVVIPRGNHPITARVDRIKLEFPGTIDTVGTSTNIKKTILLTSSEYARPIPTPALIDLNIINERPNPAAFKNVELPIAVLLEGQFESVFKNRLVDEFTQNKIFRYKEISKPTAMLIVADGDIIKNYYSRIDKNLVPYPLGADKWFKDIYYNGNREFILNAVNYLVGDHELIVLRGRKLKIRLLDRTKIMKERSNWQIINVVFPPLIIILLGIFYNIYRHRKYSR